MFRLSCLLLICLGLFSTRVNAVENTSLVSQLSMGADTCTETLDKEGDLVAVARRHDGCVLVDVSDPENPSIITTINPDDRVPNATPSIDIWDVDIHNGYLYMMNRGEAVDPLLNNWVGLYIYDIAVPNSPVLEGWLLWGGGIYHHLAGSVHAGTVADINGIPHAFLCSDITGDVEIFNVMIPSAPIFITSIFSPGYFSQACEVVVQNDRLFSAWGDDGFTIHDVALLPLQPDLVLHQPYIGAAVINGGLRTLCPTPDGNHLVTGEYTLQGDVRLWDISNLGTDAQVNQSLVQLVDSWKLDTGAILWTVRATDDFAFVAHLEDGLQVLDIRDRSGLSTIGCFDPDSGSPVTTWAGIADVVVEGTRLFASHQTDGLYVVDFGGQVEITKAQWWNKKKRLTVWATASNQPDANLELVGYGPMAWNNKRKHYEKIVSNVSSNPGLVIVVSDLTGFDDAIVTAR